MHPARASTRRPSFRTARRSTGRWSSGGCCARHADEFVTTVCERLLTYALGRGLDASDTPAVRKIKRDTAPQLHRFESLIQAVVTSTPFQMRMAQAGAN